MYRLSLIFLFYIGGFFLVDVTRWKHCTNTGGLDWKHLKRPFDNGSLAAYYISVSHTIFKQKTIEEAITRYGVESWVWIENAGTHQAMGFSKPPINSVPRVQWIYENIPKFPKASSCSLLSGVNNNYRERIFNKAGLSLSPITSVEINWNKVLHVSLDFSRSPADVSEGTHKICHLDSLPDFEERSHHNRVWLPTETQQWHKIDINIIG